MLAIIRSSLNHSLAWLDLPPRLCAVIGGGARASAVRAEEVFPVGVSKVCGSGGGSSHARLIEPAKPAREHV